MASRLPEDNFGTILATKRVDYNLNPHLALQNHNIYQANLVSSLHGQWLGKNGQSELL